jgi:mono/diheme cytochrome c family protein
MAAPSLHIRKLAALGCLAATALAVSACGGTSGSSSSSSSSSETSSPATTAAGPAGGTTTATTATTTSRGTSGGSVAAGKVVFKANCGGCHTLKDAGTSGSVGPNLDKLKPNMATVQHQVENGGGGMPAFGGQLKATQIASVAKYVSSVAGKGGTTGGGTEPPAGGMP